MRKIERGLWFAAVVLLLFLVVGLRAGWSRDRNEWRATVAGAVAAPVVLVVLADDGQTVELWRGLPDGAPSRLVSELEPMDGQSYRDLRDALAGVE
jgi:hypothetical protein